MSERATASFEITTWDEQPYHEEDGIKLSRTRVVKRFRGEIEGESTGELAGISGKLSIDNLPDGGHVVTLDYELG